MLRLPLTLTADPAGVALLFSITVPAEVDLDTLEEVAPETEFALLEVPVTGITPS